MDSASDETKIGSTGQSIVKRTSSKIFAHEYGYCMCVGEASAMVSDSIFTIKRFRYHFKSTYQITIAHCSELSSRVQNEVHDAHNNAVTAANLFDSAGEKPVLNIIDICLGAIPAKKKRLRSFFCKTAAFVMSSARHTMLIDTDIVWFQNPDLLFSAPGYLETGALFFRDRHFLSREEGVTLELSRGLQYQPVVDLINRQRSTSGSLPYDPIISSGDNLEQKMKEGRILALNDGHGANYFWRCAYDSTKCMEGIHNQDSSVVMIDKHRNHRK